MNCKYKSIFTKRKAFTLIELLIVIAIIGILFIVLVSKVDFATDKAKTTGVQTDFRSFQVAIESVAKENVGLATFGWDTGDTNGNRIRDSYDKGDINKNGKQDPGEVFIGSKTYGESWTGIYTLTNPADANDKSAIVELETAINKNLDPKLHITIADDYTITMANGAKDPWDTEYHGIYLSNASADNMDRGAILMFSNGANQKFGTKVKIEKGVVTAVVSLVDVNTPDNNKLGSDDYVLAVSYSYTNGYGETATITKGFSNNQTFLTGNSGNEFGATQNGQYIMLNSDNIYIRYSNKNLIFRSSADFSKFQGVKINGTIIDSNNYTVTSGSTVIELKSSYLETLNDGTHTIEIVSNDGSAISNFICKTEKYIIPEGGTYYVGVNTNRTSTSGYYSSYQYTEKYVAGEEFPDIVQNGDVYIFGDFEYRYNCFYKWDVYSYWVSNENQNGWGVDTIKNSKTAYGSILSNIKNFPVNTMSFTFEECTSLVSQGIPQIPDTITNMSHTFWKCSSVDDFSDVQIPYGVTALDGTFQYCSSLTSNGLPTLHENIISLGGTWDGAFAKCTSLIDISHFIIPNSVVKMDYTFEGCTNLINGGWPNIPDSVMSMRYTFANCTSITDLSNFKFPASTTDLVFTFSGCSIYDDGLPIIPITVTELTGTFQYCKNLVDLRNYSLHNGLIDIGYLFNGCSSLKYPPKIPPSVTILWNCFRYCSSLIEAPILPQNVVHTNSMFEGCTSLVTYCGSYDNNGDFSNYFIPDTVERMPAMFKDCVLLTVAPSKLPQSAVEINNIFNGCISLTTAPLIHEITFMDGVFANCTSLTGNVVIKTYKDWHDDVFVGVDFEKQDITLIGGSDVAIDKIGLSGLNYCTGCNGRHKQLGEEHNCHGGVATCSQKAICIICNQEYGKLKSCSGGVATCQNKAVCQSCGCEYGNLAKCSGGIATCTNAAICSICGQTYGDIGTHVGLNGKCIGCGIDSKIESSHNPYQNNQQETIIGMWDYQNAKSVTITITYQTENTAFDWIYIMSNNLYLNNNGQLVSSAYKFGGSKTTQTFSNVDILTGCVIFRTDGSGNNYYGVLVEVTPNY